MRTAEQNRAHVKAWSEKPGNRERAAARAAQWRRDNPERAAELKRDWARRNPDKVSAGTRRRALRAYGLTPEQWDLIFERQGRRCGVCRNPEHGGNGWHTDHDHETGRVRGILCVRCNIGIGQFEDDPARLRAAADYLEK